jgi:hypothetical protein
MDKNFFYLVGETGDGPVRIVTHLDWWSAIRAPVMRRYDIAGPGVGQFDSPWASELMSRAQFELVKDWLRSRGIAVTVRASVA